MVSLDVVGLGRVLRGAPCAALAAPQIQDVREALLVISRFGSFKAGGRCRDGRNKNEKGENIEAFAGRHPMPLFCRLGEVWLLRYRGLTFC